MVETGSLVGHLELPFEIGKMNGTLGGDTWGAFDPQTGAMYFAFGDYLVLAWYGGSSPLQVINVTNPGVIAYDANNGFMYVTGWHTDNVSMFDASAATPSVTTIQSASDLYWPRDIVYDSADGLVYVLTSYPSEGVTVINGTTIEGTVTIPALSAGAGGSNEIFDPVDGDVYVSYLTGHNVTVSVVNGTRVIGNLTLPDNVTGGYAGYSPSVALDPTRGLLYFGSGSGRTPIQVVVNATETNGTGVAGTINNVTGGDCINYCWEMGYAPTDGTVLFPDFLTNVITIVEGTEVVGRLSDPSPSDAFYNPPAQTEYVSDADGLGVISTFLSESLINLSPTGNPNGSVDLGQPMSLVAALTGIGTGNDSVTLASSPAGRIECNASVMLMANSIQGTVTAACSPLQVGNVTMWLNISDGIGRVWSRITAQIFLQPMASEPDAIVDGLGGWTAADVNQTVAFLTTLDSGSAPNLTYQWNGLPGSAECNGLSTNEPTCAFFATGNLSISVTVMDGDGSNDTSPPLAFQVYPRLLVFAPSLSRSAADVNQLVLVTAIPDGGTGSYRAETLADGGPATCAVSSGLVFKCTFPAAGRFEISTVVNDTNGNSVKSSAAVFVVDPLPGLAATAASRVALDVGQTVTFWANSTVSSGTEQFTWSNLPSGCAGRSTNFLTCRPTVASSYDVSAMAMDKNGGVSAPSTPVLVVISSALMFEALHVAPATPTTGTVMWINATIAGGTANYSFSWSHLPPGCTGATAEIRCEPMSAGTYSISVTATDGNEDAVNSSVTTVNVVSPTHGQSLLPGQSLGVIALIGGIAVAAAAAATMAVLWNRKRRAPPAELAR